MRATSVFQETQGRWRHILVAFGVDANFLTGRHGPCPMCGGKDRWRFDDKEGRGTWICNQCGSGGPLGLLEKLYGWDPATVARRLEQLFYGGPGGALPPPRVVSRPAPDPECIRREIWRQWTRARPAALTGPVWLYLRSRGISYDAAVPVRERTGGKYPEMLFLVMDPGGSPCQLHRTVISPEGAVRYLMKAPHPPGSSIHVKPWERGPLGVAEGVESALAASQCYNLPVWAAVNANRLRTFVPPPSAKQLIVFADNDENDVGKDAAIALARRVDARMIGPAGINVKVLMPWQPGTDYNDVLLDLRMGDALGKLGIRQ